MSHIGKWAALIAAAVLAVASDAPAQAWRGPDGTPSPPSESRKQVEGFGAMVLITTMRCTTWVRLSKGYVGMT
jgi:hypothetical protein